MKIIKQMLTYIKYLLALSETVDEGSRDLTQRGHDAQQRVMPLQVFTQHHN